MEENKLVAEKLFNRDELRRLEKAAKEKDKRKLLEWGELFELQMKQDLERQYNENYIKDLGYSVDNFTIAIFYTLHFSEETKFGKEKLAEFMKDINATIDLFKTGEETPESYIKQLQEDGITMFDNLLNESGKKEESK